MYPRVLGMQQFVDRVDDYFLVNQHGNAVADVEQCIEVMGDDHHGNTKPLVELQDQLINAASGERIKIRSGLIEKKDAGVEGKCTGKCTGKCGSFDHSTRKLGGEFQRRICWQCCQLEFY